MYASHSDLPIFQVRRRLPSMLPGIRMHCHTIGLRERPASMVIKRKVVELILRNLTSIFSRFNLKREQL